MSRLEIQREYVLGLLKEIDAKIATKKALAHSQDDATASEAAGGPAEAAAAKKALAYSQDNATASEAAGGPAEAAAATAPLWGEDGGAAEAAVAESPWDERVLAAVSAAHPYLFVTRRGLMDIRKRRGRRSFDPAKRAASAALDRAGLQRQLGELDAALSSGELVLDPVKGPASLEAAKKAAAVVIRECLRLENVAAGTEGEALGAAGASGTIYESDAEEEDGNGVSGSYRVRSSVVRSSADRPSSSSSSYSSSSSSSGLRQFDDDDNEDEGEDFEVTAAAPSAGCSSSSKPSKRAAMEDGEDADEIDLIVLDADEEEGGTVYGVSPAAAAAAALAAMYSPLASSLSSTAAASAGAKNAKRARIELG